MLALWFARDWVVGIWCFLYVVIAITLGWLTIRKGHLALFIVGFLVPFLWLVGALLPDRRRRDRRDRREDTV